MELCWRGGCCRDCFPQTWQVLVHQVPESSWLLLAACTQAAASR